MDKYALSYFKGIRLKNAQRRKKVKEIKKIKCCLCDVFVFYVDEKYTGCKLRTMELLCSALIGICAIIRLNMVVII